MTTTNHEKAVSVPTSTTATAEMLLRATARPHISSGLANTSTSDDRCSSRGVLPLGQVKKVSEVETERDKDDLMGTSSSLTANNITGRDDYFEGLRPGRDCNLSEIITPLAARSLLPGSNTPHTRLLPHRPPNRFLLEKKAVPMPPSSGERFAPSSNCVPGDMDPHAGSAASPKSYSLFDAGPTIFQRDPHNSFGSLGAPGAIIGVPLRLLPERDRVRPEQRPSLATSSLGPQHTLPSDGTETVPDQLYGARGAPVQIQTNTFPSASKAWKPKRPPKYKGRFYPVIGGREGNCMYKKKKHAMQQAKGVPNASLRAFNLYEKAKEWLDGQLEVDIQWMTPKELAPYTRMSSTSGCDSRECSSDEENGGDGPEHADKTDKVFTVIRNRLGQPVIVCTRYPLPGDVDGGPGNAPPQGHFLSYGAAEASLRAIRRGDTGFGSSRGSNSSTRAESAPAATGRRATAQMPMDSGRCQGTRHRNSSPCPRWPHRQYPEGGSTTALRVDTRGGTHGTRPCGHGSAEFGTYAQNGPAPLLRGPPPAPPARVAVPATPSAVDFADSSQGSSQQQQNCASWTSVRAQCRSSPGSFPASTFNTASSWPISSWPDSKRESFRQHTALFDPRPKDGLQQLPLEVFHHPDRPSPDWVPPDQPSGLLIDQGGPDEMDQQQSDRVSQYSGLAGRTARHETDSVDYINGMLQAVWNSGNNVPNTSG